jgi:DNA-directed RNA polymerase I subunit RPA2
MDGYPNGTNAVVAVISYTGYDMEDAMILNKSSHERGFGYGTIYKSIIVDLKEQRGASKSTTAPTLHFGLGRLSSDAEARNILDQDGLPFIGAKVNPGDPIAGYEDDNTGRTKFVKYKGDETGFIDTIRLIGTLTKLRRACEANDE